MRLLLATHIWLLVATALVYELTLATADDALIRARPCPILANR